MDPQAHAPSATPVLRLLRSRSPRRRSASLQGGSTVHYSRCVNCRRELVRAQPQRPLGNQSVAACSFHSANVSAALRGTSARIRSAAFGRGTNAPELADGLTTAVPPPWAGPLPAASTVFSEIGAERGLSMRRREPGPQPLRTERTPAGPRRCRAVSDRCPRSVPRLAMSRSLVSQMLLSPTVTPRRRALHAS